MNHQTKTFNEFEKTNTRRNVSCNKDIQRRNGLLCHYSETDDGMISSTETTLAGKTRTVQMILLPITKRFAETGKMPRPTYRNLLQGMPL